MMKSFFVVCVLLVVGSVECGRVRRLADPEVAPAPPGAAPASDAESAGMSAALTPMEKELKMENDLGGPVNTAGLSMADSMVQQMNDADASPADKLGGMVAKSTDFSGFLQSAKKPEATNVELPAAAP